MSFFSGKRREGVFSGEGGAFKALVSKTMAMKICRMISFFYD